MKGENVEMKWGEEMGDSGDEIWRKEEDGMNREGGKEGGKDK